LFLPEKNLAEMRRYRHGGIAWEHSHGGFAYSFGQHHVFRVASLFLGFSGVPTGVPDGQTAFFHTKGKGMVQAGRLSILTFLSIFYNCGIASGHPSSHRHPSEHFSTATFIRREITTETAFHTIFVNCPLYTFYLIHNFLFIMCSDYYKKGLGGVGVMSFIILLSFSGNFWISMMIKGGGGHLSSCDGILALILFYSFCCLLQKGLRWKKRRTSGD